MLDVVEHVEDDIGFVSRIVESRLERDGLGSRQCPGVSEPLHFTRQRSEALPPIFSPPGGRGARGRRSEGRGSGWPLSLAACRTWHPGGKGATVRTERPMGRSGRVERWSPTHSGDGFGFGGRIQNVGGLRRQNKIGAPRTQLLGLLSTGGASVTTLAARPDALSAITTMDPVRGIVDPRKIPVDVEIVVPVYNEAEHLVERVTELRRYLDESFPFRALVTLVDNASTDETFDLASRLAAVTPGVAAVHLPRKGRGHALRTAWSTSVAEVVAYMDVDLSTSLSALLPLVAPLLSGHRDVATGTRLARGSNVVRGTKRELISRSYNLLLRSIPSRQVHRRSVRLQGSADRSGG